MEATVIVTFLALAQFQLFGVMVGAMRQKHGVLAPAETGHEEFERMNRVHLNTAEQLIIFIPALWMHALYANPLYGAIIAFVICNPLASKLEARTAEEVAEKTLAMVGVESILKGDNSLVIQSKLEAFLAPREKQAKDESGGVKPGSEEP